MVSRFANTKDGIRRLNTVVMETGEHFAVQLYQTVVYEEDAHRITLRHGGYVTVTTASRIRQALAYRGIAGDLNIKGGEMFFRGLPFINGTFIIDKPEVK